jgi:hypothetical protein
MRKGPALLSGLLLALALACGGGSTADPTVPVPPVPAQGLTYTDPTGTGWRLVKDASSTATRIVLNLVGPSGLMTRGVGFNLKAPTTVRFGFFTDPAAPVNNTGWPIKDTGVYELVNTAPVDPWTGLPVPPDPQDPILLAGAVKKGNLLTVGIFQKDRRASAKDSAQALCQIAIEFDAAAKLNAKDAIALSIVKAKYIPEDLGAFNGGVTTWEMLAKGHPVDMTIAVGSLHAN